MESNQNGNLNNFHVKVLKGNYVFVQTILENFLNILVSPIHRIANIVIFLFIFKCSWTTK